MRRDFFLGGLARGVLLTGAACSVSSAILGLFQRAVWWEILLAALQLGISGTLFSLYLKARRDPILSVGEEEIAVGGFGGRCAIRRAEVEGVKWSNASAVCLGLKSGRSFTIMISGLAPSDRPEARGLLEAMSAG